MSLAGLVGIAVAAEQMIPKFRIFSTVAGYFGLGAKGAVKTARTGTKLAQTGRQAKLVTSKDVFKRYGVNVAEVQTNIDEMLRVRSAIREINPQARVSNIGFKHVKVTKLKAGEDIKVVQAVVREKTPKSKLIRASKAKSKPLDYRCSIEICPGTGGGPELTGGCRDTTATLTAAGTASFSFKADGGSVAVSFDAAKSLASLKVTQTEGLPTCTSREFEINSDGTRSNDLTLNSCGVCAIGFAGLSALRE